MLDSTLNVVPNNMETLNNMEPYCIFFISSQTPMNGLPQFNWKVIDEWKKNVIEFSKILICNHIFMDIWFHNKKEINCWEKDTMKWLSTFHCVFLSFPTGLNSENLVALNAFIDESWSR